MVGTCGVGTAKAVPGRIKGCSRADPASAGRRLARVIGAVRALVRRLHLVKSPVTEKDTLIGAAYHQGSAGGPHGPGRTSGGLLWNWSTGSKSRSASKRPG